MSDKSSTKTWVPNESGESVLVHCDGRNSYSQLVAIAHKEGVAANPIDDSGPNMLLYDILGLLVSSWNIGLITLISKGSLNKDYFSKKEVEFTSLFKTDGNGSTFKDVLDEMNIHVDDLKELAQFPGDLLMSSLIKGGLIPFRE